MEKERGYIGIDISQDNLDIADYPTEQIWKHKNSHGGIAKTVAKLKGLNPKLIVMEATGGLETPLRQALDQAGLPVAVINPRRIRDFARSMGILAKTDKLVAKIMAYFAAKIEPTPHPPPDEDSQKLENLLVRRNQISDMLTAEKNRLKQSTNKAIQVRIQDHIKWPESELKGLDKELKDNIGQNPLFMEKIKLYKSMPGVGDVLSYTLLANLSELGGLNRWEIASLVG